MTPPFLLIAEREFRAYVATVSFWVALAVGPLALAGALGLATLAARADRPASVSIDAPSREAWRSAAGAVIEAASLDGRTVDILPAGDLGGAARLTISLAPDGERRTRLLGEIPLSPSARALVARTVERDDAVGRLRAAGVSWAPIGAPAAAPPPSRAVPDTAAISRFALVMMLWLTLTGSLGMLLQAVVRERANRALESLLAAARPADVVAGKLAGVGGVSLLVLVAWLAAAAALAPFAPASPDVGPAVLAGLDDPLTLARAGLIYLFAFGFYGLVTVAVGAGARDTAQAQNLSRPMFAVLLAAFFAALTGAACGGGGPVAWLVYLPPFTPFMLLLAPPGALPAASQTLALGLLAAATGLAGWAAVRRLDLAPNPPWKSRTPAQMGPSRAFPVRARTTPTQ